LAPNLKPQDVMVTLGAGDITKVYDEVMSYYNAIRS
jgi:UDP-N-acetylmuramate-alanine ligase